MSVFKEYSDYYDLLYNDKNYAQETQYIDDLIKNSCSKCESVLELGCGTGLHAVMLAKKGYKVRGIDQSETMLQKANERKENAFISIFKKLDFHKSDIRHYQSDTTFDVVLSVFHVMSYMQTHQDLQESIQTASRHLKKNGLFIFDCWHGPAVLADKPVSRTKAFENEILKITRVSTPITNLEAHTVDVHFDISIQHKETKKKSELQENHLMRYLFPDELKALLEAEGFEISSQEEWLTKKNTSDKTWNATYICKKIK